MSTVPPNSLEPVSMQDVRQLRQAADTLSRTADHHRAMLIKRLGVKRYIFNTLNKAAHQPASGCALLWHDGIEQLKNQAGSLGEYLLVRALSEQTLPQAVLMEDGKKYYL